MIKTIVNCGRTPERTRTEENMGNGPAAAGAPSLSRPSLSRRDASTQRTDASTQRTWGQFFKSLLVKENASGHQNTLTTVGGGGGGGVGGGGGSSFIHIDRVHVVQGPPSTGPRSTTSTSQNSSAADDDGAASQTETRPEGITTQTGGGADDGNVSDGSVSV